MEDQELVKTMHQFFKAVLRLRQDMRQRISKKLEEHGYCDVTLEMTQVMYYLRYRAEDGRASQQEIANRIGKNKSSLTSLINNLVKRNMVERKTDPDSRRNNIISLSPTGEQFMSKLYPTVYKTYDIDKLSLSLEDIQRMTDTMNGIMES
ncbi:MAG: MarR family transcriptional regulator [Peptostreptococcaceae bacterium]|nr:MarR family transcriptional regulator [Peptostreptococcaceae bacterium]